MFRMSVGYIYLTYSVMYSTLQSSAQRDFVIMATRTPQRDESSAASGNSLDKEWVTEHARQVGKEGHTSYLIHTVDMWCLN